MTRIPPWPVAAALVVAAFAAGGLRLLAWVSPERWTWQRLRGQVPNLLTALSGVAALAGVAVLSTEPMIGLGLLALGQVFDCLDGYAARRLDASSLFGAKLDWSVDVAVTHALLGQLGQPGLALPVAVLQAVSLTRAWRVSGRTVTAAITAWSVLC